MEKYMNVDRLRYELQLMGKRVILTPILVMLGFAAFAGLLAYLHVMPARFLSGGLEMILPLSAGVIVTTVISHDPAVELQLTMPRKYDVTGIRRLLDCCLDSDYRGPLQLHHLATTIDV